MLVKTVHIRIPSIQLCKRDFFFFGSAVGRPVFILEKKKKKKNFIAFFCLDLPSELPPPFLPLNMGEWGREIYRSHQLGDPYCHNAERQGMGGGGRSNRIGSSFID